MNIYVGNLSYGTAFGEYGQVESAAIITDRATGRPRGFGFVQMVDDAEAQKAIEELNGKDLDGRPLKVNQARERTGGGGGGGGGRGPRREW